MNRKLLAAVAGCLAIPAFALAQAVILPPANGRSNSPAFLPEPTVTVEPIIPAPQPLPKDAPPPVKSPAKGPDTVIPVPKSGPAAEIVLPKRIDSVPAATIGQPCCDPVIPRRRVVVPASQPVNPPGYDNGLNFAIANPTLPPTHYWINAEYLLWASSGMHIPALVTSSPAGTSASTAGVLGQPTTSVLFGDQNVTNGFRSGLRIGAGFWFDDTQTLGLEGSFLYLGQARQEQVFNSAGSPGIARPYFNAITGMQSSEPTTFAVINPDASINPALTGTLTARTTSDLWGMDFNFRRFLYETDNFRLDGLVGYRMMRLRDTVQTNSSSTVNDSTNEPFNLPNGTTINILDSFQSTNNFEGGQIGLSGKWQSDRWTVGATAKLALGVNDRAVVISGGTNFASPGGPATGVNSGLLTLPSINGRYSSSNFSVIPEVGVTLGYQVTPNIRIFSGYSFLYWTNVVRAGDQISTTLNTSQLSRTLPPAQSPLVGPALPTFVLHETNYWAQGVNFGVELKW